MEVRERRPRPARRGQAERRRLEVLYDITRRLAAVQQTDEILTLIVNEAARVLGADAAGLRLLEGDELVLRAHTSAAQSLMSRTLKVGESLAGRAVATAEPVIVEDLSADTRHDPAHKRAALELGFNGLVTIPLRARGKALGALSLFSRRRRHFAPDELTLLLAFADQAAVAIEKDRLLQAAEVRADRLAALARLNQALTSSLDLSDVLGSIADAAAELMDAPGAGFWIADDGQETLTLRAFSNERLGADMPARVVPFGFGVIGWVARHRRALNVTDIARDPRITSREWLESHGLGSELAVPVLFRDTLMGVIALFGPRPFLLDAADQHFLDNFATQAGAAIRNARLYEELRVQRERLERRTSELDLLNRMGELLQASGTEGEAYEVFASFVGRFFPTENTIIAAINPSRNLLEIRSVSSIDAPRGEDVFGPDDCWALRRGRAHLVEAGTARIMCKHLAGAALNSAYCIPLMAQGEAVGVLSFLQEDLGGRGLGWDEDHQRLAVTVADQLGLAIANLKLRETLRNQSIRDPLTGLFNRRYMEETLDRELARAERGKRPVTVIMLDLDHFKEFNDGFGHDAGDLLLREVGRLLRANVRKSDLACRYGGEEFVLILPDAPIDLGVQRMDRLRLALRDLSVLVRGQTLGGVTLSAGIASFPEHGLDSASLLVASDRALYRAKREGRDRVHVAEAAESATAE
jgi:diguanylate cyclase (GGDEF)-like protein